MLPKRRSNKYPTDKAKLRALLRTEELYPLLGLKRPNDVIVTARRVVADVLYFKGK
jgi:hypothetical protein